MRRAWLYILDDQGEPRPCDDALRGHAEFVARATAALECERTS